MYVCGMHFCRVLLCSRSGVAEQGWPRREGSSAGTSLLACGRVYYFRLVSLIWPLQLPECCGTDSELRAAIALREVQ